MAEECGAQRAAEDDAGDRVPPVVTLAALHGAGGSVVGPKVAERLGVPLLDRVITSSVAEQMRIPEAAAAGYDTQTPKQPRGPLRRYLDSLGWTTTADGTPVSSRQRDESEYRATTEAFLARATVEGGVVVGRGASVVLGSVPGVLHVMLRGPREARIEQAMWLYRVDRQTAEAHLDSNDRERISYVRQEYGVDPQDPSLYHLLIDSTALDLDTCVDMILTAARARASHRPSAQPTAGPVADPRESR